MEKRRTKHYNYFDNANVEDELEKLRWMHYTPPLRSWSS